MLFYDDFDVFKLPVFGKKSDNFIIFILNIDFIDCFPRFNKRTSKRLVMPRIAEIDRAILAHLRKNGRMSYVELARDIGASERTIRTHVRKMEDEGIIRGYTIREGGLDLLL